MDADENKNKITGWSFYEESWKINTNSLPWIIL